ncbi:MAG: SIS domain-containing protein [Candidatus Eremiobacteraeota bacterium]|nr:SIS domain-containing protein [Candidatus Eremiobacteraeota bacterium]MBC5803762.1 SIS domain-containing protein [Candidatus Eremiobacteraeota bacterium]MBC5821834.1 SIS domain-containing protein [Candidatus Eremiobacteraeota bacterium]
MLSDAPALASLAALGAERLRAREAVGADFFAREAPRLTDACAAMAERFERGGRLFAFGRGPYATDAAHLSVEFVHPVIVGKRALPALDASAAFEAMLEALAAPDDIAIGLGPPEGDEAVLAALERAQRRGVLTFALPGMRADYAAVSPTTDVHVHQEIFELLGHCLYESVHVFLEHGSRAGTSDDGGAAGFLYPFLGAGTQTDRPAVARSIVAKAADGARLREQVAQRQSDVLARAALAIGERLAHGGRILTFGNGGSATDATDFALDCIAPECGFAPIPALSLAAEPAILTAVGNDVGMELTFVRQLIAQARAHDVAFAFSTSGGSKNVVAALETARARGLLTVALLGYDGGEIVRRGLCDHAIVVEADYIPRIQEVQAAIYHVLRVLLEATHDAA